MRNTWIVCLFSASHPNKYREPKTRILLGFQSFWWPFWINKAPFCTYLSCMQFSELCTLKIFSQMFLLSLSLSVHSSLSTFLCLPHRFVQCSGPVVSVRSLPQSAARPVALVSARRLWRASLAVGTANAAMAINTRQTPTRVRCVTLIWGPMRITQAAFQSPLLSWSGALRGQSSLCLLQSLASWPLCLWWSHSFATMTLQLWKHQAGS